MKIYNPPTWKWYSLLFLLPPIAVGLNLILYGERVWRDPQIWLVSVPLTCLFTTLSWYSYVRSDEKMEARFPNLSDSRKRIFFKSLRVLIIMPISVTAGVLIYDHFQVLGYRLKTVHLVEGIAVSFAFSLVFRTLYEGVFIFNKYKEKRMEREMIEKLAISQDLDALKNQINPHFLFNCFNTLSSLISVDKERAEAFLNELSKVYRYLLRSNESGVSTLGSEVKFIESYFQLLRTRHGDSVRLTTQIEKQYETYLLPSLSLQLLVENAVKHNTLSKTQPLSIDIFTTAGNKLIVVNNLQRRMVKALSNRVGLENIRAKYQLLRQPGFQVIEDERNFTVVLPLIWKAN